MQPRRAHIVVAGAANHPRVNAAGSPVIFDLQSSLSNFAACTVRTGYHWPAGPRSVRIARSVLLLINLRILPSDPTTDGLRRNAGPISIMRGRQPDQGRKDLEIHAVG